MVLNDLLHAAQGDPARRPNNGFTKHSRQGRDCNAQFIKNI